MSSERRGVEIRPVVPVWIRDSCRDALMDAAGAEVWGPYLVLNSSPTVTLSAFLATLFGTPPTTATGPDDLGDHTAATLKTLASAMHGLLRRVARARDRDLDRIVPMLHAHDLTLSDALVSLRMKVLAVTVYHLAYIMRGARDDEFSSARALYPLACVLTQYLFEHRLTDELLIVDRVFERRRRVADATEDAPFKLSIVNAARTTKGRVDVLAEIIQDTAFELVANWGCIVPIRDDTARHRP